MYLTHTLASVVAADGGSAPSFLKVGALVGLCVFVASVLIMWLGITILARANRANISTAARQSAVGGIGLIWIMLGVGGTAAAIVTSVITFLVNK